MIKNPGLSCSGKAIPILRHERANGREDEQRSSVVEETAAWV